MKLGKLAPKHDPRTLKLEKYTTGLPAPPKSYGWSEGVKKWGMYANDQIGDCTIACIAHLVILWTYATHRPFWPTVTSVIGFYSKLTGYNDRDGSNDNGAVILDVLKRWQKLGLDGHKISGYAAVDIKNGDAVKNGIYIFGGLNIGLALPVSAQDQHIWDVTTGPHAKPGSWGGHCVCITDYDEKYLRCITWGKEQFMTWAFFFAYCDEAYVQISPDFLKGNKAPNGMDIINMEVDIKKLAA